MFQIIIDFSTTYYGLPNICLYHLHRKQWLPSLVLSRSISVVRTTSKCQRATHSRQPAEGSSPGYSQAAFTPSSCVQSLNTEGCCLDGSLASQALGQGSFSNHPPGYTDSLWIMSSCVSAKAQISKGLCTSCSGLLTSYPGGSPINAQLGNWINITSALYSHSCAVPPPDPICQTVSFEFDLFLDPDT